MKSKFASCCGQKKTVLSVNTDRGGYIEETKCEICGNTGLGGLAPWKKQ